MVDLNIEPDNLNTANAIAIIGMAGHFPGANSLEQFWQNLVDGVESITFFDKQDSAEMHIDPGVLEHPDYVGAEPLLEGLDQFDASFFSFNPKQAEVLCPEVRLMLECAWEALENAGYAGGDGPGSVGVFAGSNVSNYLAAVNHSKIIPMTLSGLETYLGNDLNYLATQISYHLNLKGPSLMVQSACSTALVAIHVATQSLLNGECDMALAGAVNLMLPQGRGYVYQEGGIFSSDGHCKAFGADSQGTLPGSGLGLVVLKRLEDALADGDTIRAVIRGSAINNDGAVKVGYTAPSIDGQAAVVAEALEMAEVAPETITYIEAHGTGTTLGDPIEIQSLSDVFRASTQKKGFCSIGSVKSNLGHLGVAAGMPSVIKTVLALENQVIPPSLHWQQTNPKIDFANSPFYVAHQLTPWTRNGTPRRAGVSSLGVGGTNVHLVIEEAPSQVHSKTMADSVTNSVADRPYQTLALSAKTETALEQATLNLANYLAANPQLNLTDVAHTLQVGRRGFKHRRWLTCQSLDEAVAALRNPTAPPVLTGSRKLQSPGVVFMFSGQGAQYINMARDLYESEAQFRESIDHCSTLLKPHLNVDLRSILYPEPDCRETAKAQLQQTAIAQPALFVVEYALAQLWMTWGIQPKAMVGHSIGEYVAATLAEVFTLEEALALVVARGQLMQQQPNGSMLSVPLSAEESAVFMTDESLVIAVVNGVNTCVVSGSTEAIDALAQTLETQGIQSRRLHTSHGFHSPMMAGMVEPFLEHLQKVTFHAPQIPYLSNVTGTWITEAEATDPQYWANHVRQTVQFGENLQHLCQNPHQILLEVGPGRTLSKLAKQHPEKQAGQLVLTTVRHPKENYHDVSFLLQTLGKLWLSGVEIDWASFYADQQRYRVPLPTYPFERKRYWLTDSTNNAATLSATKLRSPSTEELWQPLTAAMVDQANQGISQFDREVYVENLPSMEQVCLSYLNLAFQSLGFWQDTARTYSFDELVAEGKIAPRYQQLFCRWLDVLVERGHLQQVDGQYCRFMPEAKNSLDNILDTFKARWIKFPQMVELAQQCGNNLAAIITGQKDPLEIFNSLVYQQGKASNPEMPLFAYYSAVMRASLEQIVTQLSDNPQLRVLEVGGGQGLATTDLLPILPPERSQYTFTDIGQWFLNQAKKKFNDYPFVNYKLLNIETAPESQGYERHSFDVIIAANVLHVAKNLENTLDYIHSLLAPGGILLLWEITTPLLFFDITSGLLMNPLEDNQRSRGNPFLSSQQWQETLTNHGFAQVSAQPESDALGQHIIVARTELTEGGSQPAAFTVVNRPETTATVTPVTRGQVTDKKPHVSDWFYGPSWSRSHLLPPPSPADQKPSERWLIFKDDRGISDQIISQLNQRGDEIILVQPGNTFQVEVTQDSHCIILNPRSQADYQSLFQHLEQAQLMPTKVIHSWQLTPPTPLDWPRTEQAQYLGFYSLLFMAQALPKETLSKPFPISVLSHGLHEVIGTEVVLPEKTTILGPIKTIPQEVPNVYCRSIDLSESEVNAQANDSLISNLIAELDSPILDPIVAYRHGHRWVEAHTPLSLEASTEEQTFPLTSQGVYLIVGGLGSLGLVIAEYLAETVQAKLVLTGRSQFPAREQWAEWLKNHSEQEPTSRKILQLQNLETLGSEILVAQADVADLEAMAAAVNSAETRFGKLNGVIHAAATDPLEIYRPVAEATETDCQQQFRVKVQGVLVLDTVLQNKPLDFCLLISSLASLFGGVGLTAYSAANIFLDHFVQQNRQTHFPWLGVNWDGRVPSQSTSGTVSGELTVTPAEDIKILKTVLASPGLKRAVVSTRSLQPRLDHWMRKQALLKDLPDTSLSNSVASSQNTQLYSRPDLEAVYREPSTETEKKLVPIWQNVMGVTRVGIDDNFFELGGDSLVGIQVISQIRQTFQIDLPMTILFEALTVAGIAEYLDTTYRNTPASATALSNDSNAREDIEL
ncbi:type I polyketide synthase [Adonisia turfae]|uniref:Phenolphthiocerol/phthiocerol polyketide synthase subunit E n=1 Tax=Adonisia turfae CCMR0081 TaxID=2292702 RepID=A0A6M0RIB6_9CYAN|nr:type I polyketide synthase [Adonisia turfae]NEZ55583.1 SDR family NAD(P)-dependent oxidoreductase [Adonisia turfae CCMR0081]